jgi:hypothetical protein
MESLVGGVARGAAGFAGAARGAGMEVPAMGASADAGADAGVAAAACAGAGADAAVPGGPTGSGMDAGKRELPDIEALMTSAIFNCPT